MGVYILSSVIVIYLGLCLFAWLFSDKMIFLAPPCSYQDDDRIIKLSTRSGETISATHILNEEAEYTILYSHGNTEEILPLYELFEQYQSNGFSVLAYEYKGYGTSEGMASEQGCYEAIESAYDYLVNERNLSPEKILLYGRSLGGGPSCYLAAKRKVGALILEGTFTSTFRVRLRWAFLPIDRFRNINRIQEIDCPLLIIHGDEDEIVPFQHGEKLFQMASTKNKEAYWVKGAMHNDLVEVGGSEYWEKLKKFSQQLS